MGKLHDKMASDLVLRGFSAGTNLRYLNACKKLAQWYGRSPAELSAEEVLAYLLHLRTVRKKSLCIQHMATAGLKFLYGVTLRRPDVAALLPWPKVPQRLPELFSAGEIASLLQAANDPRLRTMMMVAYGAGLRVSEICALQIGDIGSDRGVIRVRQGKGAKDRESVLPERLLHELRRWWRFARPEGLWMFPANSKTGHVAWFVVQAGFRAASERAGLTRKANFHSLRHCFATHLLESGVELTVIQSMLGHARIQTTQMYAQVRTDLVAATPDLLAILPPPRRAR